MNNKQDSDLPENKISSISGNIVNYYNVFSYYKFTWTFKENAGIRGFINIIPIKESVENKLPGYMHGLRMLDYFIPEACVGYYMAKQGKHPDDQLYFLYFEDEPQGLNVNMDGYIELLYMARGFAYWQKVLLFLKGKTQGTMNAVEEFKTWMPIIFPAFKWEEFVALYERVKIN